MTPEQFIDKWRGITRSERSAAYEHFLDLCALLEVPKPADMAAAYGWPADLSEEEALARLLALKLERSRRQ